MKRLRGKRAVVTGGSNGIGRAIVEAFLHEGADVLFTFRRDRSAADEVRAVGRTHGASVDFIEMDAAHAESAAQLWAAAEAFLGSVDILVNNAATMTRTAFLDITPAEYQKVMDVNLRFSFFATQLFSRHMRDAGSGGRVINVSSISAFSAVSKMAHYQCSKAALDMLTRGAAFELAPHGIRVNSLSPGLTATNANRIQWERDPALWSKRSEHIPLGRPGIPSDHAGAAVFLASDESSWMTGTTLVVDGGSTVTTP